MGNKIFYNDRTLMFGKLKSWLLSNMLIGDDFEIAINTIWERSS